MAVSPPPAPGVGAAAADGVVDIRATEGHLDVVKSWQRPATDAVMCVRAGEEQHGRAVTVRGPAALSRAWVLPV